MLKILFCGSKDFQKFEKSAEKCVEEVIVEISKKQGITPNYRHIFGLRNCKDNSWLPLSKKLNDVASDDHQFRVRFKPFDLPEIRQKDPETFNYYYFQIRDDFVRNKIPSLIKQPETTRLGLVMTDVVHYLTLHKDRKIGDVVPENHFPNHLYSIANWWNVKKTAKAYIGQNNVFSIKNTYLEEVESYGSNVGVEEYKLDVLYNGNLVSNKIVINPSNSPNAGIVYESSKKLFTLLCKIEDIVTISARYPDLTVELFRNNGVPYYLKCDNQSTLESVISCLSGYYRLIENWTIDLCGDLDTPSLKVLKKFKCHGPVGKKFATKKLLTKAEKESGLAILYESSSRFDVYNLLIHETTDSIKKYIICSSNRKLHFDNSEKVFNTFQELLNHYISSEDPKDKIGLTRLLYPSDFDCANSVRICRNTNIVKEDKGHSAPRVFSHKHFEHTDQNVIYGNFSDIHSAMWIAEKKMIAIKVPNFTLPEEKSRFLDIMDKFTFTESCSIVKMFGIILQPLSLVMELLPFGPLDQYLKNNKTKISKIDLMEASASLANALWYLNTKEILHNNIRCSKLLVESHSNISFKVKLGDPGINGYNNGDIHWIPIEHHHNPSAAILDPSTDFWAFGTTLWEIFNFGLLPLEGSKYLIAEIKGKYASGNVLPRPKLCPVELYFIMTSICWSRNTHTRRQPQIILRDVNNLFCQIYHQVRNPYENDELDQIEDLNMEEKTYSSSTTYEQSSVSTQVTNLSSCSSMLIDMSLIQLNDPSSDFFNEETNSSSASNSLQRLVNPDKEMVPRGTYTMGSSKITFEKKIGEGNYGLVYLGWMNNYNNTNEFVAIKEAKVYGTEKDFLREFTIMKRLEHPNIVRLLGVLNKEKDITFKYMVMEYIANGSLKDYIHAKKDVITDRTLLMFAYDIALGMDYLETQNVIHRDLAARNILVTADENHVKISDFGLAQTPNEGSYYIARNNRDFPFFWFAIESLEFGKFSPKSDVWSYGVTCWEMFTRGLFPYQDWKLTNILNELKMGKRLCLESCPQVIYLNLIRPCWAEKPADRPCFSELQNIIKAFLDNTIN